MAWLGECLFWSACWTCACLYIDQSTWPSKASLWPKGLLKYSLLFEAEGSADQSGFVNFCLLYQCCVNSLLGGGFWATNELNVLVGSNRLFEWPPTWTAMSIPFKIIFRADGRLNDILLNSSVHHNVLSSLPRFQQLFDWRRACLPETVSKQNFVSTLLWNCWERGRDLSTLCCTPEFNKISFDSNGLTANSIGALHHALVRFSETHFPYPTKCHNQCFIL